MRRIMYLGMLSAGLMLAGCQSTTQNANADKNNSQSVHADAQRIKSHLRFLSDDLLEGRDTGARGHEIASLYIASELEGYGLTPAGDNGSFLQRAPFRQASLDQASPSFVLETAKGTVGLAYPKQYITSASPVSEPVSYTHLTLPTKRIV